MHDALAVRSIESIGDFHSVARDLLHRQDTSQQTILQRLALQTFHDQKINAILAADVVQGADIRML